MICKKLQFLTVVLILFPLVKCSSQNGENIDKTLQICLKNTDIGKGNEQTSYVNANKEYEDVIAKIDGIMEKHPSSSLIIKINNNEVKFLGLSYHEFKTIYVPKIKQKAMAEKDIISCAVYLSENFNSKQEHLSVLCLIAPYYIKNKMQEEAVQIVNKISQSEDFDSYRKFSFLEIIAGAYVDVGDLESARKILNIIRENAYTEHLLQSSMLFLKTNQNTIIEQLTEKTKSIETLSILAKNYSELGMVNKADAVLSRCQEIIQTIENQEQKIAGLKCMCIGYEYANRYDKADEILRQIWDYAISKQDEQTVIFCHLIKAELLLKKGTRDEAIQEISKAQDKLKQKMNQVLLSKASLLYLELDKYQEGISLANLLESSADKDEFYSKLVMKYIDKNMIDEALEEAKKIRRSDLRNKLRVEASKSLTKLGKKENAIQMLNQSILDVINSTSSLFGKVEALKILGDDLYELGQLHESIEVTLQALKIIQNIERNDLKIYSLIEIAPLYSRTRVNDANIQRILHEIVQNVE